MSPEAIYTPKSLRELADAEGSPFRPHLMNEYRKALRWAANVIEAADQVIEESRAMAQSPASGAETT